MDTWELIRRKLALRLTEESYQNWFARTAQRDFQDGTLWISVPSVAAREYIEQEYSKTILDVIRELRISVRRVVYEVTPTAAAKAPSPGPSSESELVFQRASAQLNPNFTFTNFVVGSCNQFAHAAAQAVVSTPAGRYNPLFIYGGVGMGKTHLMHAIGQEVVQAHPGMRIVYTSSERFMNEMIVSIRQQRMPQFHQHYRAADILLVDDIHVLGRKEATQEEFFHTFNELYEHQKQIVISSDSPPRDVPGLVDRLRSRFEWGLMVDVQAPDLETKMAILDKKARTAGISLPEDIRIYIATRTKSNIRELEGALNKLSALSSVMRLPITMSMAQQALKHLVPNNGERRVTIDSIIRAVAAHYGLQPSQLKQKSNRWEIARPRQVAMYLAKDLTQASLPEIGRAFAGKHHTTVLHSVQRIEELRHRDPELNRVIQRLMDSFG